METNIVAINDRETALKEGVKRGYALARSFIEDGEFEANIDTVAAWAESVNLELTVGSAYSIIAIAVLRCMLGNEIFDTPVETENGEFDDEAMNMGMNAILDRIGLEQKDGKLVVRAEERTDE